MMSASFVPFILLLVMAVLFFVPGRKDGGAGQQTMKKDLNFYLICGLVTSVVSIIAGANQDWNFWDTLAWIVLVVAAGACVWRYFDTTRHSE